MTTLSVAKARELATVARRRRAASEKLLSDASPYDDREGLARLIADHLEKKGTDK